MTKQSLSFPFSAIVGQDDLKHALVLSAVDPSLGGVLALGDRGTGKTTAVRALAALLPEMKAIAGCATIVQSGKSVDMPIKKWFCRHGKPRNIRRVAFRAGRIIGR